MKLGRRSGCTGKWQDDGVTSSDVKRPFRSESFKHVSSTERSCLSSIFKGIVEAEKNLSVARNSLAELCEGDTFGFDLPVTPRRDLSGSEPATECLVKPSGEHKVLDELLTKCLVNDNAIQPQGTGKEMDGTQTGGSSGSEYVVLHANHPNKELRLEPQTIPMATVGEAQRIAKKTASFAEGQGKGAFLMVRCYGGFKLPVAFPNGRWRMTWVLMSLPLITYECFAIPYYIAFEDQTSGIQEFLDSLIFIYYVVDIFFSSLTGYMDYEGRLIMVPHRIFLQYLRTWLLIDMVAAFPWSYMSENASAARLSKIFRGMHTLKMLHLLRWINTTHTKHFSENVQWYIEKNQLSMFMASFAKVFFLLFGVTHWAACIWYLIGSKISNSWTDAYLKDYTSTGEHYVISLYFTLTTMTTVGYGDITPKSFPEIIFVLFLLLCAGIVFASLLGQVSDLVQNWNSQSHIKAEVKTMLSRYSVWRAIPQQLAHSIREHMVFCWDTTGHWDSYEVDLMKQLPPYLKSELCYHLYGRVLLSTPCFAWLGEYTACIKKLANHVRSSFFDVNDHLFKKGDACKEVHILLEGAVWLTQNNKLAAGEDEIQEALYLGASSFMIPRNKQIGLIDVGRNLAHGVSFHSLYTQKHVLTAFKSLKLKNPVKLQTDDYKMSQNGIIKDAALRLKSMDHRLKMAALRMQQAWRKKRERERDAGKQKMKRAQTKRAAVDGMSSTSVHAPAYFGESCLWVPAETWSTKKPGLYAYCAKCTVRCEVLTVPRKSVSDLLDEFSPWLGERLETFQEFVQDAAKNMAEPVPQEVTDQCTIVDSRLRLDTKVCDKDASVLAGPSVDTIAQATEKDSRLWPNKSINVAGDQTETLLC